jgi:hypothetical protein
MSIRFLIAFLLLFTSLSIHAGGIGSIFRSLLSNIGGNTVEKIATSEMIEKSLMETADIVNKELPKNINSEVRYDSVFAGPGRHFTHNYSLLRGRASDVDVSVFNQDSFPKLRNLVCTDPDSRHLVKNDVVVSFTYRGNDSRIISTIDITPSDCSK